MIRKRRKEGMRNDGGKGGEEGEMRAGGSRKEGDMNKEGRGRKDGVERQGGVLPGPLATNWLRLRVKNVLGK